MEQTGQGPLFDSVRSLAAVLNATTVERDSLHGDLEKVKAELQATTAERDSLKAKVATLEADAQKQLTVGEIISQAAICAEKHRKAIEENYRARIDKIQEIADLTCWDLNARLESLSRQLECEKAQAQRLEERTTVLKTYFEHAVQGDLQEELVRLRKISDERADALRMFEARELPRLARNDTSFEEWCTRIKTSPRLASTLATGPDGVNAYAVLASNGCVYFPGVAAASELGLPATHDVTNTGQFWTENLDKTEGFRLGSKQ